MPALIRSVLRTNLFAVLGSTRLGDESRGRRGNNTEAVLDWLDREGEIQFLGDDFFSLAPEVQGLARALVEEKNAGSILIQGDFGSGKTSLLNMAGNEVPFLPRISDYDFGSLLIVKTSLWARADHAPARVVLDAVLSALTKYADVASLIDVPANYRRILDAAPLPGLRLLSASMAEMKDPHEVLQQINALAHSIGIRVYVAIEDFDRTLPLTKSFDDWSDLQRHGLFQTQRLLEDLRKQSHIGAILTVSGETVDQFDEVTMRVIARQFAVPRLRALEVQANVIIPLCTHVIDLSRTEGIILPWLREYSTTRYQSSDDSGAWKWISKPDPTTHFWNNIDVLGNHDVFALLMGRPRLLRVTLKTVRMIWSELAGEINLEDVILYATLESYSGGKFASFVRDYWDPPVPGERDSALPSSTNMGSSDRPVYDEDRLEKLLETVQPPYERPLIKRLVDWFLPMEQRRAGRVPCQSTRAHQRYRRRLINRRVSGEDAGNVIMGMKIYSGQTPKDQEVLQLWAQWRELPASSPQEIQEKHHPFVQRLNDDFHFSDAFECLASTEIVDGLSFGEEHFFKLFDQVMAYGMGKHGGSYTDDLSAAFVVLWRWFIRHSDGGRFRNERRLMVWLETRVRMAMMRSLDFATTIDSRYQEYVFRGNSDWGDEYRAMRRSWVESFFDLTAADLFELIGLLPEVPEDWDPYDNLKPSIGWQLFRFVEQHIQSENDRRPRVPFTEQQWGRLTPILIRCMKMAKESDPSSLRSICVQIIRLFADDRISHKARDAVRIYELRIDPDSQVTEEHRRKILGVWLEVCPEWNKQYDPLAKGVWDQVVEYLRSTEEEGNEKQ